MKFATTAKILATGLLLLMLVFDVAASDPIFVKWLVVDNPGDETIRYYWERAEAGELGPEALVDLGTMLFYRGWSGDAVGYFNEALELDPEMSEAWFRIGLVKHHGRDLDGARSAYKKCLKKQSGHAWANFYLGLLEEQTGEAAAAMKHFETAFQHAPELANPKVNPEILSSMLQLGAQIRQFDSDRFERSTPMPILEPATMRKVQRQFSPAPISTPTLIPVVTSLAAPSPTPAPAGGSGGKSKGSAKRSQKSSAAAGAAGSAATRGSGGSKTTATKVPESGSTPYGVPKTAHRGGTGTGTSTSTGGGTGTGREGGAAAPQIGETSPEASLQPVWPGLYRLAGNLI